MKKKKIMTRIVLCLALIIVDIMVSSVMFILTRDFINSSDGSEQVGLGARRKVLGMSASITGASEMATEANHTNSSLKGL